MLANNYRFHGYGSLKYVFKNGSAIRTRLFTIKHVTNPRRSVSRYSVVVSKKVHKGAVGRNRIRRRVYELLRLQESRVTTPHDIVVIISSSEVMTMPATELQQALYDALAQTALYVTPEK